MNHATFEFLKERCTRHDKDNFSTFGDRVSGRTYRAVLRCLLLASTGKTVIFVATHIDNARDMAGHIVRPLMGYKYDHAQKKLTLPGGGAVIFRSTSSDMKKLMGIEYSVCDLDEWPIE